MVRLIPDILNIILAARVWKNLPLLFIFLSGISLGGKPDYLIAVILGIVSIAFSSAFMTHLNIITDKELDLIEKPHLYKMLSSNVKVMKTALIFEFSIAILAVIYLYFIKFQVSAAFIVLFMVSTILYSYNFFSKEPQKNRFKVFWHGHFLIVLIGYLSLWIGGFLITGNFENLIVWLPVFFGISLSEYSLFLFESSVDQKDEERFKLKTFSAILGKSKTTIISVFLALSSIFFVAIGYITANSNQIEIITYSFIPVTVFITCFLSYVATKRLYNKDKTYKVPDIIFNFGRIYILLSIIYINLIQ
jgi:4-hydroxybenzoate polyprenyltransferase